MPSSLNILILIFDEILSSGCKRTVEDKNFRNIYSQKKKTNLYYNNISNNNNSTNIFYFYTPHKYYTIYSTEIRIRI